jgi:hypothetical protein
VPPAKPQPALDARRAGTRHAALADVFTARRGHVVAWRAGRRCEEAMPYRPIGELARMFLALAGVDGVVTSLRHLADDDAGFDWRHAWLACAAIVVMSSAEQREAYAGGACLLLFRYLPELVDKPPQGQAALLQALF